jgi:hypothetical protein
MRNRPSYWPRKHKRDRPARPANPYNIHHELIAASEELTKTYLQRDAEWNQRQLTNGVLEKNQDRLRNFVVTIGRRLIKDIGPRRKSITPGLFRPDPDHPGIGEQFSRVRNAIGKLMRDRDIRALANVTNVDLRDTKKANGLKSAFAIHVMRIAKDAELYPNHLLDKTLSKREYAAAARALVGTVLERLDRDKLIVFGGILRRGSGLQRLRL